MADGSPVGWAYVAINGRHHSMTGADGQTRIPAHLLHRGDTLSASFVGMQSVPLAWDGRGVVELELVPLGIDAVRVTARDRSRQLFKKYVKKIGAHGWFTGFSGEYDIRVRGGRMGGWRARGTYDRNHLPGSHANALGVSTFALHPRGTSQAPEWQIQRYILGVKDIAEKAASLEEWSVTNRGMIVSYRGREEGRKSGREEVHEGRQGAGQKSGRHVFLIVKPWFDKRGATENSFQTLIWVDPDSGHITSSKTLQRTAAGTWDISAEYLVHSGPIEHSHGGRSDKSSADASDSQIFIYAVSIEGRYTENSIPTDLVPEVPMTAEVTLRNRDLYHF